MQSLLSMRSCATKRVVSAASRTSQRPISQLCARSTQRLPIQRLRPRAPTPLSRRFNSSLAVQDSDGVKAPPRPEQPSYQLTFTCKPCKHRSSHVITKHGYHKGTVLIKCPSCASRHVISDHLNIFMDEKSTLEDILQKTAGTEGDVTNLLKKGKLGMRQGEVVGREGDEDIEFWDDGSESTHSPAHADS